jgi:AcrR family transcriptional regulator
MVGKEQITEKRRKQILDAAVLVFSERGFHGARMDDIVKQSGLSKGALYWYFESKDQLIETILDDFFEQELVLLRAALSASGTVSERLKAFTLILMQDMQEMPSFLPIAFEFYAAATRQSPIRETLQRHFRDYRSALQSMLDQGVESGELRQVDTESIAVALMALFEGLTLLWVISPAEIQMESMAENLLDMLLETARRAE